MDTSIPKNNISKSKRDVGEKSQNLLLFPPASSVLILRDPHLSFTITPRRENFTTMSEDPFDQFASALTSVEAHSISADPRSKLLSSRGLPSLSAASDASSTGSESTYPSSPFNARSGKEGRFEYPPPSPPPRETLPSYITSLQEVSPLSALKGVPHSANNNSSDPSGGPSTDSRRIIKTFKAQGNAKQELQIYFDRHKQNPVQLPKTAFVTWDDGNLPHVKRFTCIFVSPLGEAFPSGELWDARSHSYDPVSNIHWYSTNKEAIEAAAARAIDCLNYRSLPRSGGERFQFGKEYPYDNDDHESPTRDLPSKIPQQTKQEIRSLRGII
jgi:hypothetical protein